MDKIYRNDFPFINGYFYGGGEKGLGLVDLGDDLTGCFFGNFGDGEVEDGAFRNGGVEAGTGVEIHQ